MTPLTGGYDPARVLALMHVPKSFGTSLTDGLSRAIQPRRAVTGFDRSMFGAFDAFDTFDPATRAAVFLSPAALPDVDLVAGHISCSTLRARYGGAQLVTVLREPVSRLLSHWLFWRGHGDAQLVGWGTWAEVVRLARLPLEDFLGDPRLACQNDNQVVRMLLWPHALLPANAFIDAAHDAVLLAQAEDRLRSFDFSDIAEGCLAERLRRWLRRPFVLEHRHETAVMPAHLRLPLEQALTEAAFDALDRCSRLDRQLWLTAAQRDMSAEGARRLAERTRLVNVARFAGLMTV